MAGRPKFDATQVEKAEDVLHSLREEACCA